MSTKADRSRVREQLRRARSAERMNSRWSRAQTPQGRCKAVRDYLSAYIKNAPATDQRHLADQLKDLASQTRATRPSAHAWMITRLKAARAPALRAEIAMQCLAAYARHGSDQGAHRIATRLKSLAEATRTAR